jgi:exonuclease III
MVYKYKTKKVRNQKGKGILTQGIKVVPDSRDRGPKIPYIKKCPEGFVMCDQDEVNYSLCVPNDRPELCSDPNYEFKYVPPDETDRNAINPRNRLIKEVDGKGPIQDPRKPVKAFEIEYDGEEYKTEDPDNPAILLNTLVLMDEEKGRLKSYAPEYHPTSCAIQQKTEATIDKIYENGLHYRKRKNGDEIALTFTPVPSEFTILTQNALGLYRGTFGQVPKIHSADEATYDLMRLRTASFRDFLKRVRPDFVCIQESTRTFIDLLDKEEITTMYPYLYPTEEEMAFQEANGANATTSMLSKYPAKRATTYMLQGNSSYYNALGVYEFDNLIVFNVYMQAGSEISPGQKYKWENYARCRRQQLMFIKQKIDEVDRKAIVVLGDFNFELNSIAYTGVRDANNHLIYDPLASDMKWSEHKFLVGPRGLNLYDSYKELHNNDPNKIIREGLTENTAINTFRYLSKLEEKALRYDGIFFNDLLIPLRSEVVNNVPVHLNVSSSPLFVSNGITDYEANVEKYNREYGEYMVFNPKGNVEADEKKREFFETEKGAELLESGYELFVSDHFGVMTTFRFKQMGGKRRRRKTRRYRKKRSRKTCKR